MANAYQTRQNSNKCLFEFDSLVDVQLGIVLALQKEYPSGGFLKTINYSFLHQPLEQLKQFRVFGYGRNIIQECFNGKVRDSYQTIIDQYRMRKETYDLAPRTLIPRMIKMFSKSGFIKSVVLCHTQFEYQKAQEILNGLDNISIIKNAKESDINVNEYARIHLGDIRDLDKFNPFDCTHISILNYGSNLQLIRHDVILLREYIIKYGDTNIFEIIDSYSYIECPDYGKI